MLARAFVCLVTSSLTGLLPFLHRDRELERRVTSHAPFPPPARSSFARHGNLSRVIFAKADPICQHQLCFPSTSFRNFLLTSGESKTLQRAAGPCRARLLTPFCTPIAPRAPAAGLLACSLRPRGLCTCHSRCWGCPSFPSPARKFYSSFEPELKDRAASSQGPGPCLKKWANSTNIFLR